MRLRTVQLLAIGSSFAAPAQARAQDEWIVDTVSHQPSSFFGRHACLTIDIDGDGVRDVVSGAAWGGTGRRGAIVFLSGVDLALLRVVNAPRNAVEFGQSVSGSCGDFDGDGFDDLVVTDRRHVFTYSPKLSKLLERFPADLRAGGPLGDVDGDGADDVALDGGIWVNSDWQSLDYVFSGRTGALLSEAIQSPYILSYPFILLGTGPTPSEERVGPFRLSRLRGMKSGLDLLEVRRDQPGRIRGSLALGDLDGDSCMDVLSAEFDWDDSSKGEVRLHASRSQKIQRIPAGRDSMCWFAYQAIPVPDLDGDGLCDIVASDPIWWFGSVSAYSSASLKCVWTWAEHDGCGVTLELIPDRDGGGVADLLIGGGENWDLVDWVAEASGFVAIVSTRSWKTLAMVKKEVLNPALAIPEPKR